MKNFTVQVDEKEEDLKLIGPDGKSWAWTKINEAGLRALKEQAMLCEKAYDFGASKRKEGK